VLGLGFHVCPTLESRHNPTTTREHRTPIICPLIVSGMYVFRAV